MTGRILVTGATGAIAKQCVRSLLASGYTVRGTVRSLRRASDVTRAVGVDNDDPRVEIVAADLLADDGWDAAVSDCIGVLHVASPFPLAVPQRRDDIIQPAQAGTKRVLLAAQRAGCRRVVVTSSIVAVVYPGRGPQSRVYTETDWTDPTRRDVTAYVASKTLAEQAAWDVARSVGAPEVVTINPGLVLGPVLDPDLSSSHELIRMIAMGKYPALPRVGYAIADIRDVAEAHVQALRIPSAAGERFLIASGFRTLKEIGRTIVGALPDTARRVPTLEVPDTMLRLLAMADRTLAAVLPDLGVRREVSGDKAAHFLGLTYRPPDEAIVAAARSLRSLKLI